MYKYEYRILYINGSGNSECLITRLVNDKFQGVLLDSDGNWYHYVKDVYKLISELSDKEFYSQPKDTVHWKTYGGIGIGRRYKDLHDEIQQVYIAGMTAPEAKLLVGEDLNILISTLELIC